MNLPNLPAINVSLSPQECEVTFLIIVLGVLGFSAAQAGQWPVVHDITIGILGALTMGARKAAAPQS